MAAAAADIKQVNKPTDYVNEHTNMSMRSADIGSVTADIADSSSRYHVPEMDTKPVNPISDGNAPDFKLEFFNEKTDYDELRTLQKSELATELTDGKADGDNGSNNGGDVDDSQIGIVVKTTDCIKKMPLVEVSHHDSVENPDFQSNLKQMKIKSKGSNEDCKLSQKVAAVGRSTVHGFSPSVFKRDKDMTLINDMKSLDQKEKRTFNQEASINDYKTDDKYLRQSSSPCYSCCVSYVSKRTNGIEPEERSPVPNVLPSAGKDVQSDSRSCKSLLKENSLSFDENVTHQSVGTELRRIACEKCPA